MAASATSRSTLVSSPGTLHISRLGAPDRSKPIRVLQIGSGNLFGGIEVCQLTLAAYRHAAPSMQLDYAYCFAGKASADVATTGAVVHVLGAVRYSRPWSILAARRSLARLLEQRAHDVVLCHGPWVYGIFAPAIRKTGLPLLLWVHDRHSATGTLERLVRRTPPDFVIANSHWSAEALPRFLPGIPFRVVYCPVRSDESSAEIDRPTIRRRFDTADDALVILQVGRWEVNKGHLWHLDALAALRDVPGWVCWQVGAPQRPDEHRHLERVRERAASLGILDRLRFLGWQQEDLPAIRHAADIYCQPTTRPESFGLTLIEALSAGLPVIASAGGGASEIVTPDCGVLVTPGSRSELTEALRRLLTDTPERHRLQSRGPQRARELCDPAQQVRALEECLSAQLGR